MRGARSRRGEWGRLFLLCGVLAGAAPEGDEAMAGSGGEPPRAGGAGAARHEKERAAERRRMVEEQIEARGVVDRRVLEAMRGVPRHRFVPRSERAFAYEDRPLPIGHGATISQPFMVAVMTELLELEPEERVLEVGTGSGYQAAVLARLVAHVTTIEIVPELAESARRTLAAEGVDNVTVVVGDGWRGVPEAAPFDAIVVTAAPPEVPKALLDQLAVGGRLVIPVGDYDQDLRVLERTAEGVQTRRLFPVRFVPLVKGERESR